MASEDIVEDAADWFGMMYFVKMCDVCVGAWDAEIGKRR